jgi:1-phosphatidylinositol phosphodiesterase
MNSRMLNNYAPENWMESTPGIDNLTLHTLALPGTHNAGCDWQASYALIPGRHWVACQHKSFYDQLKNGARALDLRWTYNHRSEGVEKYRIQHNGFLSSRTLGHLQTDVIRFLSENPDEFIIFDFHEMKDGDQAFDFVWFNKVFLHLLANRIIPSNNSHLSLRQLKDISPTQRILVHATRHHELNREWFCDKIEHAWIGTQTPSANDVKAFIGEVLAAPPSSYRPWSLSATSYTALGGPVDIHADLDLWFDPDKSDWLRRCNIVNIDFIEESKLVRFCRTANLIKSGQR